MPAVRCPELTPFAFSDMDAPSNMTFLMVAFRVAPKKPEHVQVSLSTTSDRPLMVWFWPSNTPLNAGEGVGGCEP